MNRTLEPDDLDSRPRPTKPVALWVAVMLALSLAASTFFGLIQTSHQLGQAKRDLAQVRASGQQLQITCAALQHQQASALSTDSLKFVALRRELIRVQANNASTQDSVDQLATRAVADESRLAALAEAQKLMLTKTQIATIVKTEVAPVAAQVDSQVAVINGRVDATEHALGEQSVRISNASKQTKKSRMQRMWEAVITAVAITGLYTGGK